VANSELGDHIGRLLGWLVVGFLLLLVLLRLRLPVGWHTNRLRMVATGSIGGAQRMTSESNLMGRLG